MVLVIVPGRIIKWLASSDVCEISSYQAVRAFYLHIILSKYYSYSIMVFEWQDEGKFHRVPKLEPGPPNVYFGKNPSSASVCPSSCSSYLPVFHLAGDVFSTPSKDAPNPLTGSMFLLEKMENPGPAPPYDYDESGVVLKGQPACQLSEN